MEYYYVLLPATFIAGVLTGLFLDFIRDLLCERNRRKEDKEEG